MIYIPNELFCVTLIGRVDTITNEYVQDVKIVSNHESSKITKAKEWASRERHMYDSKTQTNVSAVRNSNEFIIKNEIDKIYIEKSAYYYSKFGIIIKVNNQNIRIQINIGELLTLINSCNSNMGVLEGPFIFTSNNCLILKDSESYKKLIKNKIPNTRVKAKSTMRSVKLSDGLVIGGIYTINNRKLVYLGYHDLGFIDPNMYIPSYNRSKVNIELKYINKHVFSTSYGLLVFKEDEDNDVILRPKQLTKSKLTIEEVYKNSKNYTSGLKDKRFSILSMKINGERLTPINELEKKFNCIIT